MTTVFKQFHIGTARKATSLAFFMLVVVLMPQYVYAAPLVPSQPLRVSAISGTLANASSAHYFKVQPSGRDVIVTLTLSFGAQGNQSVANKVNLWVLSPESLKSFQGGANLHTVALASGNPMPLKADDYKAQASFKITGINAYTVIVYSKTAFPTIYTLQASNAMLIDNGGQ